MDLRIGIDLGGTKTEVIALDQFGEIHARKRTSTPGHDYDSILKNILDLTVSIETKMECQGSVGVGIPGVISTTTGLVKNANLQCLIGKAFDVDLSNALKRPVRLSNDANCFALSEAVDGAGKSYSVVFGVIIGTGTGGGIVVNGEVLTGTNAITGEWGHNPLPWPTSAEISGPQCYCGRSGCLETYLSGPGLSHDHFLATGERLNSRDIVSFAENNDSLAQATLERYINRLARGLASIINVLDPDVIVLGGGLSSINHLYEGVPHAWKEFIFSDEVGTSLKQAVHGDSSGVRGAAWLWPIDKTK